MVVVVFVNITQSVSWFLLYYPVEGEAELTQVKLDLAIMLLFMPPPAIPQSMRLSVCPSWPYDTSY